MIKKAKRYEEVIAILSYNNNFLDLLEVINNNKSSLFKLFPKKESLNLKCFFNPECDYDLNKIYDQIISLLDVNYNFIKFNDLLDNFFEKFKTNFDKIILIHKIIKLIKEKNLSAEKLYSKSINTIKKYYEKEKCQMNNGQLLKYIEIVGVFKNTELSEVIKNFNISSMENNFFLKWKKVNWMKLYENNKIDKSEFYKAVCSIINNMNNFGLLFELFDINTNEKDYSKIMIIYMQNTFQKIIKSKPNCYECPNFVEDVSNLIFYSEIKKCSINIIKKILNNYQDNKIIIEQIYKRLIEKNIEYSEELTKLITEFFINKIQESDSSILFYIIKNTKDHLNDTTISYLKQFSLKEIDFFQIGENESLKLFKKLSNAGMIPDQLPDCDYKNSCSSFINKISNDLNNGNIKYNDIIPFYLNDQKDILYNKILLLANNNGEKANEIIENVNKYMKEMKTILEDLKFINEYLKLYFKELHKDKIEVITKCINEIFKNNINYYKSIQRTYEQLTNEFKNEANSNLIFKNCNLFILILNKLKTIYGYDEKKSLLKTINFIDKMKIILEENTIKAKNININELEEYAKLIDININELCKDIKQLTSILNIQKEVNFDKITEALFLLSQKNKIKILVDMFITFIEKCNTDKTDFYNLLKVIKNNIEQSKEISVIKLSKSILKNYKFDLDNNKNKIIDIFIKLGQNEEKKIFLLDQKKHSEQFLEGIKLKSEKPNNAFLGVYNCFLFVKDCMNYNGDKKLKDKELIYNINKKFENKEMVNYFNNYLDQYENLKLLDFNI